MPLSENELRKLALDFVSACFAHLRKTWQLPNVPGRYLVIGRDYSYYGINDLPEYKILFDYLAQDERIQRIYVRRNGAINEGTLDKYLVRLFQRILTDSNGELSPDTFDYWFGKFHEEILRSQSMCQTLWFLENFECGEREFHISDELKVRHFHHGELQQALEKQVPLYSYWTLSYLTGHALILTQTVDKKDIAYTIHNPAQFYKLHCALLALRLLKKSFVNANYSLDMEVSEFPLDSPHIWERDEMREPFSEKYILERSEMNHLNLLWKQVFSHLFSNDTDNTVNGNRLRLAIAYFESSYGKPWREALVDLTISLEALLLREGTRQSEHLQTRVAALIASDANQADEIAEDIETMYKLRSDVVHGKVTTQEKFNEQIAKLAGVDAHEYTLDVGRSAIEKIRGYVRSVIRELINLTLDNKIELGKKFYARLDKKA